VSDADIEEKEGKGMKKAVFWLALAALAFLGAACAPAAGEAGASSVDDGVFRLTIRTDKDEYTAGEAVNCYATLEYVGGADSTTIYSSDPLVYFTVKGGQFTGDFAVNDILKTTTFKKGEPVRFDFAKSGSFSADQKDAAFWESWYADPELKLPAGEYTIAATVDGFFDQNDYAGTAYTLTVSAQISVKP
jgi:hypothetical protein